MFDIGWSEMLVIAIVTIVFIGPKELPGVLREIGRWLRRIQSMASEFRGHVDDMMRESELHELRQQVEHLKNANLEAEMRKTVDPAGEIEKAFQPPEFDLSSPTILPPSPQQASDPTTGSSPAASEQGPAPTPSVPPADKTPLP